MFALIGRAVAVCEVALSVIQADWNHASRMSEGLAQARPAGGSRRPARRRASRDQRDDQGRARSPDQEARRSEVSAVRLESMEYRV